MILQGQTGVRGPDVSIKSKGEMMRGYYAQKPDTTWELGWREEEKHS